MLELTELRRCWTAFVQYGSLTELRTAVRLEETNADSPAQLRSACWKAFLFFENADHDTWQTSLSAARAAYSELDSRFNPAADVGDLIDDPLAESATTKRALKQEDIDLRAEILQDVVRLPEDEFLRRSETQQTMLNILFVYCKLNPDLSYRQGMHELLAPILVVTEHDALAPGQDDSLRQADRTIADLFDPRYIEHDTFVLFSRVMQNAKNFYEHTSHQAVENPLISRSSRITEDLLQHVDPKLARHLQKLAIPPQLYLMRWIRLLFGREFERRDLPSMWDIIFAEDTTLDLVDHICVAMLLRMRWDVLQADYNTALTLLLRYSSNGIHAKSLAVDALQLRDRPTTATGRRLILKYTGRSPEANNRRSITPPAMQRNVTTVSGMLKNLRGEQKSGEDPLSNIESLLQNTARNILNKGEQLGIAKAVRVAVDDIHRRAQNIRDVEPSPPRIRSPRQRPGSQAKLEALEQRNKQLAVLLERSTACLWNVQRSLAEAGEGRPNIDLEELSVAIGKVQFVQLHLQDPTMRLDKQDVVAVGTDSMTLAAQEATPLADPNTFEDALSEKQTNAEESMTIVGAIVDGAEATAASPPAKARPMLAESSYSWMLGQQQTEDARPSRPDNLFG